MSFITFFSLSLSSLFPFFLDSLEDVNGWSTSQPAGYDVISVLNLLDRCSRPLTLLKQIRNALKPDGLLLIALVWPFRPYVEFSSVDHRPEEELPIVGRTFEEQACSLMNLLRSLGFRVVSWSRVPYLCEGDLDRSFYHLSDMLVALQLDDADATAADDDDQQQQQPAANSDA